MKRSSDIRWRRSHAEAALWRYIATQREWGHDRDDLASDIPQVFRSRIKKLLNMDRIPGLVPWFEPDQDLWAFFDGPKEAKARRSEDLFRTGDVFLMGIGLDLINVGIKQPEVVFFLRHTREVLLAAFDQLHNRPGARAPVSEGDRQLRLFEDDGSSEPISLGRTNASYSDSTAWMLVRRREDREAYPLFLKATRGKKIPFFVEPEFYFGLEEVKKAIFNHLPAFRNVILIEIADLALTLPRYLSEAVVVRRGRPPRSAKPTQPEDTHSRPQDGDNDGD